MAGLRAPAKGTRPARVRPALTAHPLDRHWLVVSMRVPWSGAVRPRVGFASTSPTTRPHRADGRVPGGRLGEDARTGRIGRVDGVSGEVVKR